MLSENNLKSEIFEVTEFLVDFLGTLTHEFTSLMHFETQIIIQFMKIYPIPSQK